ncbi:rRNA-processing protein and EBNA1-binding protein ebp2 [Pichia californica]|nr:rRNA-processing protein and EBNA1-binding protein ebp2 [[Candida] californica]
MAKSKVKASKNESTKKAAAPVKQQKVVEEKVVIEKEESNNEEESDEEEEESENELNIYALNESEGDDDDDENLEQEKEDDDDDDEEEEEEEEEEEDIPLSEAEFDSDADVIPHTKLTVNNKVALKESLKRIEIDWKKYPFDESQSLTYNTKVESEIKDIYDDTERELAFFKQGLDSAIEGRQKLLALKIPFARPVDYFAEMVKSDDHMDKLKAKLVSEATEKKAREEARRQRQLKKFGKQVQHETLQQRQKEKRETLDKIKSMKKKRKNNEISGGDDGFNIAVEEASNVGSEKQREKKQKIRQNVSSRSQSKTKRPGKNRRRNKRK